jgi:hypothetical protein
MLDFVNWDEKDWLISETKFSPKSNCLAQHTLELDPASLEVMFPVIETLSLGSIRFENATHGLSQAFNGSKLKTFNPTPLFWF